jgi:hypothetical protein
MRRMLAAIVSVTMLDASYCLANSTRDPPLQLVFMAAALAVVGCCAALRVFRRPWWWLFVMQEPPRPPLHLEFNRGT